MVVRVLMVVHRDSVTLPAYPSGLAHSGKPVVFRYRQYVDSKTSPRSPGFQCCSKHSCRFFLGFASPKRWAPETCKKPSGLMMSPLTIILKSSTRLATFLAPNICLTGL